MINCRTYDGLSGKAQDDKWSPTVVKQLAYLPLAVGAIPSCLLQLLHVNICLRDVVHLQQDTLSLLPLHYT